MSTLVRSSGIVLRHLRHGESSLILTLFMREFGKIGLMAKGVRGTKKLGTASVLELFSEAQFIYYRKQGRDLQMFKEASSISPHLRLRNDLELMSVASALVELLSRCLRDEDPHPDLYDHASETLALLDTQPPSPLPVLWRFEMELFQALGFELQLERCVETRQPLITPFRAGIRYRLNEGSFLHPDARTSAPRDGELLPESFSLVARLANSSREFAGSIVVPPRVSHELQSFFAQYLETHLPVRGHLTSLNALRWSHPSQSP
jgi:DNA repair protein RecO (recombination protein O)